MCTLIQGNIDTRWRTWSCWLALRLLHENLISFMSLSLILANTGFPCSEGAAAVGVGLIAPFVMSADIKSAWFLSAEEKEMLLTVHEASGKNVEMKGHLTKKEVYSTFKSPFVLAFLPAFFMNGCILFGMSYFLPTVSKKASIFYHHNLRRCSSKTSLTPFNLSSNVYANAHTGRFNVCVFV